MTDIFLSFYHDAHFLHSTYLTPFQTLSTYLGLQTP